MDEPFQCVKYYFLNFKLNNCCYFAPVRIGLLLTGYFNIIYDISSIIGISDESYSPIIMLVEASLLEDNASKPVPLLCYCTELMFSVVLLCSVYRNDIYLMKAYTIFGVTALIISILFYSVVIVATGAFMKIAMVLSILFQLYVLLLVRSMIVEIKQTKRNAEMPPILMSTLLRGKKPLIVHDAETQVELEDPSLSGTLECRSWNTNEVNLEKLMEKSKKETELFDKVKLGPKVEVTSDIKVENNPDTHDEKVKENVSKADLDVKDKSEINKETKIDIIDEKPKQEKDTVAEADLSKKEPEVEKQSEVETVVEKPKKRRWFSRSKHEDKPTTTKKEKDKPLDTIEEKPKD